MLMEDDGVNDGPGRERLGHQSLVRKIAILTIAFASATVLLSPKVAGSGSTSDLLIADIDTAHELFEIVTEFDECVNYPNVKFDTVIHNNLGNLGPDSGDEGIILQATVSHTGAELNNTPIHVEIHNTSKYEIEGEAWPKDWNGLHGKFLSISLKGGTNTSFEMTARLPGSKETLTFPRFGMTVFDLDIGPNGAVEYAELSGFDHFYVTHNTLVKTDRDFTGTARFTATVHGNGSDNPDDPELLTVKQKHKAVTVEYSNVQKLPITVGATGGTSGRVFSFTARPILLCAKTQTPDGPVDPGKNETIENHTANGTGFDTKGNARKCCDGGLSGFMLSLVLPLLTSLLSLTV